MTEGGRGVLQTWALREKALVKFMPNEVNMREALKSELEVTPNLTLCDGLSDKERFTVRIDQANNFEIIERDLANTDGFRLQRLPVIAVDAELAIRKLAHVLRHVSRYRDIERLQDRPRSTHIQEEKLDIAFSRGSKRLCAVEEDGVKRFEVVEGEKLGLRLKYSGPAPFVWVTLFELNPSWGIVRKYASKLVRDRLEPDEYLRPIDFWTSIPPKSSISDSSDTCDNFMAFIAEGEDEQSWDEIILDALPTDVRYLGMDTGVDAHPTTKTRAAFRPPQAFPDRHWGVVSFVVHSFPHRAKPSRTKERPSLPLSIVHHEKAPEYAPTHLNFDRAGAKFWRLSLARSMKTKFDLLKTSSYGLEPSLC